MKPSDLLALAKDLASRKSGPLRQIYLRRSVSSAYYALFHALARVCADELIGARRSKSAAWQRAYRALEHRATKNALIELARQSGSTEMKMLADAFALLQQLRHDADYDPHQRYTVGEVAPCTDLAEAAIVAIGALPSDERLTLAATLLMKTRR